MTKAFKVGDRVSWNSEAGRVSGTIIRVHMRDVEHKGYTLGEPIWIMPPRTVRA